MLRIGPKREYQKVWLRVSRPPPGLRALTRTVRLLIASVLPS